MCVCVAPGGGSYLILSKYSLPASMSWEARIPWNGILSCGKRKNIDRKVRVR